MRRLARELGIDDPSAIAATGEGGRITEDDVKSHVRRLIERAGEEPQEDQDGPPPLPDFEAWGGAERESLSRVRARTAENVARSWRQVAQVSQGDVADVTEVERRLSARAEERGAPLTLTALLAALTARALARFPRLNAAFDAREGALQLRREVHLGMAVDTDAGLLVPVIRRPAELGLEALAEEIARLAEAAREGSLRADDMAGASFTITNLGGLGTTWFTPIVPWPQVAILGVGRAHDAPRLRDGAWEARRQLPLSLSYDHRAVDGADAARFLRWIARALEDPLTLLD